MKMGNNKSVIIGFICAFCVMSFNFAETAYAQQGGEGSTTSSPNPALFSQSTHNLDTCQTNELRFNLRNINFFRDNEYQGNLTKGYTLPGFRLLPSVSYQPLKILNLEVGAYMLHYWGANKYPNLNYSDMPSWKGEQTQSGFHVLPFLRAQVALTPNFQIVIGSIYGSVHHGLIEPLYNPETALSGDPETGLQFLWDTRWFKFDTWVNWESFIFDDGHGAIERIPVNGYEVMGSPVGGRDVESPQFGRRFGIDSVALVEGKSVACLLFIECSHSEQVN